MADENSAHKIAGRQVAIDIKSKVAAIEARARTDAQAQYQRAVADHAQAINDAERTAAQIKQWKSIDCEIDRAFQVVADAKIKKLIGSVDKPLEFAKRAAVPSDNVDAADARALATSLGNYFKDAATKVKGINETFKRIAALRDAERPMATGADTNWGAISDDDSETVFDYLTAYKNMEEIQKYPAAENMAALMAARQSVIADRLDRAERFDEDTLVREKGRAARAQLYNAWDKHLVLGILRGTVRQEDAAEAKPSPAPDPPTALVPEGVSARTS